MAYLDLAGFRNLTSMPGVDVDNLEAVAPGWIDGQLDMFSADIDSRLRKRYAVPFADPVPLKVKQWLTRLVTRECYVKRGHDPNDAQSVIYNQAADKAEIELKEASDAEKGLYDLPLRQDTNATGISHRATRGYSERSPYVEATRQRDTARREDESGSGTER